MRRSLAPGLLLALAALAGCSDLPGSLGGESDEADHPPAAEAGIVSGQLNAAAPGIVIDIPVNEAGHGRLAIVLVLSTNLPQNRLEVQVSGPGGRTGEADASPFLYVMPGTRPAMSFGDPPAGPWTADVQLSSGAVADFELHWCADDADAPGPQPNLACQRDFGA